MEGAEAGFPLGAGDAPPCRTALCAPAPALPRHEEHLEGGRAARLRRAEAARAGEAAPPEAQVAGRTLAGTASCCRDPRRAAGTAAAAPKGRAGEPFKWMWDSPSLPVLICCVAWLRAATQLLPSSPEVAALQWWPAGTASVEHRPTPRPPHAPAAASLPIPSRVSTVPRPPSSCPHGAGATPGDRCSPAGCHGALKEESAEQKAGFPGETSPGMGRGNPALPAATAAPGSPGTAAASEQAMAVGEEASDTSLHGGGVSGLLQSVQQLLVQILQTSRQQQALLESLASDTVSHLHLLSHSLVQVGETLHQLLLRPQAPHGHYAPHIPLFEGGPQVPLLPGLPCDKEEPPVSSDAGCAPP
ncbi:translation initiation factor IF-2-like isoform X4 [Oxyura jamaicensis]|uniref:translation initiation factor IF-2-like isoform X4 n=1 Tax=Oxyura jamaicensis TaxID=8884 RepID=UPI0015A5135F|nr:translation initiation factor IF-2-like isoform X4 [Oxyura jamaicensis]XP_035170503.1 translation initiation factor IF-2-like isoform X4 [Oxyura jamaicensis]